MKGTTMHVYQGRRYFYEHRRIDDVMPAHEGEPWATKKAWFLYEVSPDGSRDWHGYFSHKRKMLAWIEEQGGS